MSGIQATTTRLAFLFLIGIPLAAHADQCQDGESIRHIALEGLKHTRNTVVLRELLHQEGGIYHDSLWKQEQTALLDLDLFATVEHECTSTGDAQDVHYHFRENFRWLPAPAAKKSDQDGWMLGGALAALNLGGTGTRLEGQVRLGTDPFLRDKEFALYGRSHWFADWPVDWDGALIRTHSYNSLKHYREHSTEARFGGGWRVAHNISIVFEPSLLVVEHSDLDTLIIGENPWMQNGQSDWLPGIYSGLSLDHRDSRLDTRNGFYAELGAGSKGGWLGAEGPGHALLLSDLRGWWSPARRHILLAGSLVRIRPGTVPFYEAYNSGGANTLRGWNPDQRAGGAHEIALNAEYRPVLLERKPVNILGIQGYWALQWALGVDGTLLWNGSDPGWQDWRSGVYTGPHLVLPAIGRLRMELGYGPNGGGWRFDVGMFEKAETLRWRAR